MYPFFGQSEQGNFVPLYHTQVMTDSRAKKFETMDQVPYFYISFNSLEAGEYCNNFKISKKIKNS